MKIHYYFGWFNSNIPEQLAEILRIDIPEKKSLVMISTIPSNYEDSTEMSDMVKDIWFGSAGIIFDEYHSIDYRMTKERAQELSKNASVILLHGGIPSSQNAFIAEYEMSAFIRESNAAVIMGASAGAMNMSMKFVSQKRNGQEIIETKTLDGLGLDSFALESHSSLTDIETIINSKLVQNELMPLSKEFDMYIACAESTIRVKGGKTEVMGDVFIISNSKVKKLDETLSL